MDVNNSIAKPRNNAYQKGGIIGMAAGAVGGAMLYNLTRATTLPLRGNPTISQKKNFIADMQNMFANHNIDMKNTTVSKVIKNSKKTLKQPTIIIAGLLVSAAIGTVIGACVDAVRNRKAKLGSKVEV